jgi:hypothetical protein
MDGAGITHRGGEQCIQNFGLKISRGHLKTFTQMGR